MRLNRGIASESSGGSQGSSPFASSSGASSYGGGYSNPGILSSLYTPNTTFGSMPIPPPSTSESFGGAVSGGSSPSSSSSGPSQASTGNPEYDALLQQFTSLLSGGVNASSLPTNLDTGQAFTPGGAISRGYNYGAGGGGNNMLEFLKKKNEGLGLNDPLGGFDAFKFMGGQR